MFHWLQSSKVSQAVTASPCVRATGRYSKPSAQHRIYAIGDVHGRVDLLARLLPRLTRDAASWDDGRQPVLVFLGDLVDRGDHSREVLELAIAAKQDWTQIIYLRGNHEAALLKFLENPTKGSSWLNFGGKQTLASYGVSMPALNAEPTALDSTAQELATAMNGHLPFLKATRLMFQSGEVVFSHAGIDPDCALYVQTEDALLWGKSSFLERGGPSGLRVVHGHWDNPKPVVRPDRLCLDTGAYYSGTLTAARLDNDTTLIQAGVFEDEAADCKTLPTA